MEDSFPLWECVLVWQTLLHVVPCLASCLGHWDDHALGDRFKYLQRYIYLYRLLLKILHISAYVYAYMQLGHKCFWHDWMYICCYMYVPTCTCGIYTVGKLSSVLTNKLLSTIWTRHVLSVQSQMGVNSVNAFLVPDITTWHDLICILVIGLYMYIIHWILFNK